MLSIKRFFRKSPRSTVPAPAIDCSSPSITSTVPSAPSAPLAPLAATASVPAKASGKRLDQRLRRTVKKAWTRFVLASSHILGIKSKRLPSKQAQPSQLVPACSPAATAVVSQPKYNIFKMLSLVYTMFTGSSTELIPKGLGSIRITIPRSHFSHRSQPQPQPQQPQKPEAQEASATPATPFQPATPNEPAQQAKPVDQVIQHVAADNNQPISKPLEVIASGKSTMVNIHHPLLVAFLSDRNMLKELATFYSVNVTVKLQYRFDFHY